MVPFSLRLVLSAKGTTRGGWHDQPQAMKTPHERREELRQERLAEMERQVRDGSLVIRQMSEAEKKRHQGAARKPGRRS